MTLIKQATSIAVTTVVNKFVPGVSAAYELGIAALNFTKGNVLEGIMNTVTGVFDFVSSGTISSVKSFTKQAWKKGLKKTVSTGINMIKTVTYSVGKVFKGKSLTTLFQSVGNKIKGYLKSKPDYVRKVISKPVETGVTALKIGVQGVVESGGKDIKKAVTNKLRSSAVSYLMLEKDITLPKIHSPSQLVKNELKNPDISKTVVRGMINYTKDEKQKPEDEHRFICECLGRSTCNSYYRERSQFEFVQRELTTRRQNTCPNQ